MPKITRKCGEFDMKKMLTADELIAHMKEKGITFHEVSEEDAKHFLTYHNYYMKLASYRANYPKHKTGKNAGQYINLDFGYLKELSTIDMHLRYYIVEMCLDIEHAIKVRLIEKISSNPDEDGYEIVKKFLSKDNNITLLKNIRSHQSSDYCRGLIAKYYPDFPAWVFVEVIPFGKLLYFCNFYEELYGESIVNNSLMNTVRDLRNACAHSNCLLNHLAQQIDATKQPHSDITKFVAGMNNISKGVRTKHLHGLFAYNFVSLLYVYDTLMPNVPKQKRYDQLKEFMETRVIRNQDYFLSNGKITGVYNFLKKVIDNLQARAYNISTIEK